MKYCFHFLMIFILVSCAKPGIPVDPISLQMRLVRETETPQTQNYFFNGEVLHVEEAAHVTELDVVTAVPDKDEYGRHAVLVQLNQEGARRLCRVTEECRGKRLAILVEDKVRTAPMIGFAVCSGKLVFPVSTKEEAEDFARRLSRHR